MKIRSYITTIALLLLLPVAAWGGKYGFQAVGPTAQTVFSGAAAASQTWAAGDPLTLNRSTGYIELGAATDTEFVGVAVHKVTSTTAGDRVLFTPVGPGFPYQTSITGTTAQTNVGTMCDISGTTSAFRVNAASASYQQVIITKLVSPASTSGGEVLVEFGHVPLLSALQAIFQGLIIDGTTKTAAYTTTAADSIILCDTTTTAFTVTLGTATLARGRILCVKDTGNAATNNCTIDTEDNADLIDGSSDGIVLSTAYHKRCLVSDGTNWFVLTD